MFNSNLEVIKMGMSQEDKKYPSKLILKLAYDFLWWLRKICPQCGRPRVRSLGREDPVEKGNATHSSILAWRIPWTEETGGLQSMV